MDKQEKISSNDQPRQLNTFKDNVTQESFRQNLFFAEKILDFQGMFLSSDDDYDIRKVTREKVESMLYPMQLQPEMEASETTTRPGRQGINQWIWEHMVQMEIMPSLLREYLQKGIQNTPLSFFRKYEHTRELVMLVSTFYRITPDQVEDKHLLNPHALRYAVEHAAKDPYWETLFYFLAQKSSQSGLLDKKLPTIKSAREPRYVHPRILQYQMHLQQRGLSKEHIRHVTTNIHQLLSWLCTNISMFSGISTEQIPIFRIQNDHLLAYRSYKLKQVNEGSCSPITFSHNIYAIRSFFYYLKEHFGYVPPLQRFRAIKSPRYKPREIPTDKQIDAFFQVVDQYAADPNREQIGYRLMLHLGLRLSEVSQIKWKDINLGTRTIVIHSKGNKSHVLPLAGKLYSCVLQAQHHIDPQTFLLGKKSSSIADNLYRNFKLYAMISGWSFPGGVHFFRHIFITRLAHKGILPQALKELARVARLDTVGLYTHLVHQDRFMINQINLLKYEGR